MTVEQMIAHARKVHPGETVRFIDGVCQSCTVPVVQTMGS